MFVELLQLRAIGSAQNDAMLISCVAYSFTLMRGVRFPRNDGYFRRAVRL
jgi:hypothetical protein